jgi:hypothetical protein
VREVGSRREASCVVPCGVRDSRDPMEVAVEVAEEPTGRSCRLGMLYRNLPVPSSSVVSSPASSAPPWPCPNRTGARLGSSGGES